MNLSIALLLSASAAVAGPVGFRGNGNGVYPNAQPVTHWNEYQWKEVETTDSRGKKHKERVIAGEDRTNILWKTELPFWGNNQPVLVNGRLYLLHEMQFWDPAKMGPALVCLDPATGKQLWSKEVTQVDLIPAAEREAVIKDWVADRLFLQKKWQAAWRMHEAKADDTAALQKVWADLLALGFSPGKFKDKQDQKLTDYDMGDTGRFWGSDPSERSALRKRLAAHNLWYPAWSEPSANCPGRWLGVTFPTPATDDERLYIRTGQHLLACYDLEGNAVWKVLYSQKPGYTCFAPSPVLVGDKLIVYTPGDRDRDEVLCRAFDKATGKLAWKLAGTCPDYAIGTPVALKLGGTEVVYLPGGSVVRVGDGKVLADKIGWVAGADNPLVVGDTLYLHNAQDGGGYGGTSRNVPAGIAAVKLQLSGSDTVTATTLWQLDKVEGNEFGRGLTVHNGLVFATAKRGVVAIEAATGQIVKQASAEIGAWNLAVAGNYLFSANPERGTVTVLSADRDLTPIATNQLGIEIKKPADQWHYRNEKGEWGVAATPLPMLFAGPRIYLRTWFHLYCLGSAKP